MYLYLRLYLSGEIHIELIDVRSHKWINSGMIIPMQFDPSVENDPPFQFRLIHPWSREIYSCYNVSINIEQGRKNEVEWQSCNCSWNTVREILRTAELQSISWPLPSDMDVATLMKIIYPSASESVSRKPEPDYQYIHEELKRLHVNLRLFWVEFKAQQPDSLVYSKFCNPDQNWAAKTKAVMHLDHKPTIRCLSIGPVSRCM